MPGFPFEYHFVDERIDRQYRSELRIGMLALAFTILAILITCIGLFAIATHTAQQKTKEIGVRKSHGASSRSVIYRFVTIYLRWVLLANLIAWPISWVLMKKWLENFARLLFQVIHKHMDFCNRSHWIRYYFSIDHFLACMECVQHESGANSN